jgi:hypothetical protein
VTELARTTYDRISDVETEARSSATVGPTAQVNTLEPTSAIVAGFLELAEDTRLIEEDRKKYWNAPKSDFIALEDIP